MYKDFRRKPNNLKGYTRFLFFGIPLMCLMSAFPIFILFTQEMESPADIPTLIAATAILWGATATVFYYAPRQIKAKRSYMNLMNVPILTLTESHFIYRLDEREQYELPWSQVTKIEKMEVPGHNQNRFSCIYVSYDDTAAETVMEVRKNAFIKGQAFDIVLPMMYFEAGLQEVDKAIMECFRNSRSQI